MSICPFCGEKVDEHDPDNYHEVSSWVNGPKLDGPKLRQQTGAVAHKLCVENLARGQAPDQPSLLDDEDETKGEAPLISDEPGEIYKLTGPNSLHAALTRPSMGGNADADCNCGFMPHRKYCPRYDR